MQDVLSRYDSTRPTRTFVREHPSIRAGREKHQTRLSLKLKDYADNSSVSSIEVLGRIHSRASTGLDISFSPDAEFSFLHSEGDWADVPVFVPEQGRWSGFVDRTVRELGRIQDGWEGVGSFCPSEKVIRDVETVLNLLPTETLKPEIEVDSSNGAVTVRWNDGDYNDSFSITCTGNGRAIGVRTSSVATTPLPWSHAVTEEAKILHGLEDATTRRLMRS